MKRIWSITCLLFLFVCSLHAKIIETKHFKEILNYVEANTLVLLDIDDTLMIPVQTLGTDVWFQARLKHYRTTLDSETALDKTLAEWEAIRHLTDMKIVEEGTETIVRKLQRKNTIVMGLTTQGLALTTRTINQLKNLDIDLALTSPSEEDFYFINGREGVLYRKGILFTAGTSKGDALLTLLDKMAYQPKSIVFINDKASHLLDVEASAQSRNIKFTGLRYSYSDERVAQYNPEVAETQWKNSTLGQILSDEEARLKINEWWNQWSCWTE